VGLANLSSESKMCVRSRVHLVGVSISFEKSFYRLPFTPPSGSPFRSFTRGQTGPRPVHGVTPRRGAGVLGSGGALAEVRVHRGAPKRPYTSGGAHGMWRRGLGRHRALERECARVPAQAPVSISFSSLPICETPKSVN
jgi:hypothetical protein